MPRLLDVVRKPYGGPYERRAVSTKVNSLPNDDPEILALGRSWRSFGRGRKSSLTAKIDNYSTGGEIGVKRTSSRGTTENHHLEFIIIINSISYACHW